MRGLHIACLVLAVVGAVNWGLWGLFQFDLVAALFDGQTGTISRAVYSAVGLAGLGLACTSLALYGSPATHPGRTSPAGAAHR